MKKTLLTALLGTVFSLLSVGAAQAQILLTVDISNPGVAIITATGAGASGTTGSIPIPYGIDLVNLFTDNVTPSNPFAYVTSSSLTASETNTAAVLNQYSSDDYSTTGGDNHDLSLLNNDVDFSNTISFTSGQTAFTGVLKLNLTGPVFGVGHIGNIVAGYYGSASSDPSVTNTIIGEYEITPEPATWAMLLGGLGVLGFLRRRLLRSQISVPAN